MDKVIDFISYIQEFNETSVVLRLVLAVLLGGLVGLERSKSGRAAGLRTHILVCLGAAVASMTGVYINQYYGTGDVARIAAQVISGVGFLGTGTILHKNKSTVTGLTTAACVWAVGAIGVALGYGFYLGAILGAFLISFITKTLNAIDRKVRPNSKVYEVYTEIINAQKINETLDTMKKLGIDVDIVSISEAQSGLKDGVGLHLWLHVHKAAEIKTFIDDINKIENVNFSVLIIGS